MCSSLLCIELLYELFHGNDALLVIVKKVDRSLQCVLLKALALVSVSPVAHNLFCLLAKPHIGTNVSSKIRKLTFLRNSVYIM